MVIPKDGFTKGWLYQRMVISKDEVPDHKKVFNSQDGNNEVLKDVKVLKSDVIKLKNTIMLLMQNKEAETILKKAIEDIKDDIILLTASNRYIKELLEEDTDDESECCDAKNKKKEPTGSRYRVEM